MIKELRVLLEKGEGTLLKKRDTYNIAYSLGERLTEKGEHEKAKNFFTQA